MGKKPEQQLDSSNSLSVSTKEMRAALEPFCGAVRNGLYSPKEFSIELITKQSHIKAGRLNLEFPKNETWRMELDRVLTAVDDGLITTEEFRFVVDTELFKIEVGSLIVASDDVLSSWAMDSSDSGDQIELRLPAPFFWQGVLIRFSWTKPPREAILFLLMLLSPMALGSMVYEDPVTLKEGDPGAIRFNDVQQSHHHSCDYVYFTISIEGLNRPFYVDGSIDPEGLVTPNQKERFSIVPMREGCSSEIEFIITSVRIEDEGMYVVEKIYYGASLNSVFIKRQLKVYIPPGPATCFFTKSKFSQTVHEAHCHSRPGNGNTTLTCFQEINQFHVALMNLRKVMKSL